MKLDVDTEKQTILGIHFDNEADFNAVWHAVGSSMIEGFEPTRKDIEYFKDYVIQKRLEKEEAGLDKLLTDSLLANSVERKVDFNNPDDVAFFFDEDFPEYDD